MKIRKETIIVTIIITKTKIGNKIRSRHIEKTQPIIVVIKISVYLKIIILWVKTKHNEVVNSRKDDNNNYGSSNNNINNINNNYL